MKRLRALFGGGDDARAASAAPDSATEPPEDEAVRELRLQREFYTGLSEVARHELQFQEYAPEAPSQVNRAGRWVTSELTDGRDGTGRAIVLGAQTELDYLGASGDDEAGRSLRFRTLDGRQVDIAAPGGEMWPPSIVRPSDLGTPGVG